MERTTAVHPRVLEAAFSASSCDLPDRTADSTNTAHATASVKAHCSRMAPPEASPPDDDLLQVPETIEVVNTPVHLEFNSPFQDVDPFLPHQFTPSEAQEDTTITTDPDFTLNTITSSEDIPLLNPRRRCSTFFFRACTHSVIKCAMTWVRFRIIKTFRASPNLYCRKFTGCARGITLLCRSYLRLRN